MYIFPFGRIKPESRIAIYGAGEVGQDFFSEVVNSEYCEVAVWVDENYEKYQELYYPVYPVECLKYIDFDFCVVALKNQEIVLKIVKNLEDLKIKKEKVIVCKNLDTFKLWEAQDKYSQIEAARIQKICEERESKPEERYIWLMNTPYHGNIGDAAITVAEKKYLLCTFEEDEVIDISSKEYEKNKELLCESIKKKDIIFITGGGYMGELWEEEDKRVKDMIERFPDNKIIFLPQTFYYSKSENITADKEFYDKHKDILFIHREKKSYDFFAQNIVEDDYRNQCFPDMVLSLKGKKDDETRENVLLCFRSDKESFLPEEARQAIRQLLKKKDIRYYEEDTVVNYVVPSKAAEGILERKLLNYRKCKLVITDRLHSMIFAYITNTPCIVFDNLTQKISGVYEWIKEVPYIILRNSIDEIDNDVTNMLNSKRDQDIEINQYFAKMRQQIAAFIEENP